MVECLIGINSRFVVSSVYAFLPAQMPKFVALYYFKVVVVFWHKSAVFSK